jgi:hypothetical protein
MNTFSQKIVRDEAAGRKECKHKVAKAAKVCGMFRRVVHGRVNNDFHFEQRAAALACRGSPLSRSLQDVIGICRQTTLRSGNQKIRAEGECLPSK